MGPAMVKGRMKAVMPEAPRPKHRSGGPLPAFRPVQLAPLVDRIPAGDRWLHEMKYDGCRCLIAIGGGEARV
jgi:bifunctional non-homologous end joining protein LigD